MESHLLNDLNLLKERRLYTEILKELNTSIICLTF